MTIEDFQRFNLVQAICMRPRMYTPHGTLAEVYYLLTDENAPQPVAGRREDPSVAATVQWLHENVSNPDNVVEEMLALHGTDEEALKVICDFAATLPTE